MEVGYTTDNRNFEAVFRSLSYVARPSGEIGRRRGISRILNVADLGGVGKGGVGDWPLDFLDGLDVIIQRNLTPSRRSFRFFHVSH